MKEIKICFTNPDDVKEFVRAARKCEFAALKGKNNSQ